MIDDWLTTSVPVSHSESEDPGKKCPRQGGFARGDFCWAVQAGQGVPDWGGVEEERSPMHRGVRTGKVRRDLGHV